MKSGIWHAGDILDRISALSLDDEPYITCCNRGTMSLGMYAPAGQDLQEPHDQDELYFVLSGSGVFIHGDKQSAFKPGDALFVAAGVPHHFTDFTDDFHAWVVFWGVKGGERNDTDSTPS
jgi:uncharacterized RmlC-like cupin family protein